MVSISAYYYIMFLNNAAAKIKFSAAVAETIFIARIKCNLNDISSK